MAGWMTLGRSRQRTAGEHADADDTNPGRAGVMDQTAITSPSKMVKRPAARRLSPFQAIGVAFANLFSGERRER
jgi:hypothetical protein